MFSNEKERYVKNAKILDYLWIEGILFFYKTLLSTF
jgi:hypothetical protein